MLNWKQIDTVLLDMDGTLLDLNFDNHFWNEFVPLRYAENNGLTLAEAKRQLAPRFKAMEGKLEWYCMDYWSNALDLDIAGLKQEISGLIDVLPHVTEFLEAVQKSSRQLLLVTNAHRNSLGLKMEKTSLNVFFDAIICSHDFGFAKEQQGFWQRLQQHHVFAKHRSLLVDDSQAVLTAAREFGIAQLISVSKPDSRAGKRNITEFPAIEDFRELMPVDG
ncbi:GMP/IMP nucleotidase [Methylomarinum sp. Ch1-1]|uniref:GMP/IMP nucleotidase n=1 Tax=Methylomarinum roseum TaxID=3067653 RepID=A0AAU7NWC9_9GAMM|nr:GMP/IMP nucleotidase [Methylomarinum sp. Ch1-1]MDP4522686.1 GMP/IMP nucleotidase [Methylomarinum sp. Ch1-1]